MLGIAEEFQAAPKHRIVRGLAGVAGDRLELGGTVDGDGQVDLLWRASREGCPQLGVECLGDVIGDGLRDHSEAEPVGCGQSRRGGLAALTCPA